MTRSRGTPSSPTPLERAAGAVSALLALGGGFLPGIAPPQSGPYWLGVAILAMILLFLLLEASSSVRSVLRSLTTARVKTAAFFGLAFLLAACTYFTLRFVFDYYIPLGGIVGLRGLWKTSEASRQGLASFEELWDWADGNPLKIWPLTALVASHLVVGLSFVSCLLTISMAIFLTTTIIASMTRGGTRAGGSAGKHEPRASSPRRGAAARRRRPDGTEG